MIIAVDIETKGLDARNFILGCLIDEDGNKRVFYNKKDLWSYIINLGKKMGERKKVLSVYSHNASYDFYGYADLSDRNIKFYNHNPFIAVYIDKGKEIIKFLDSIGIYKMSLRAVGEIIGIPKMEMPLELVNGKKVDLEKVKEYCFNDCLICLESVKLLKEKMKEQEVQVKRIYTISQVAINYLLTKMSRMKGYEDLFFNVERKMILRCKYPHLIHEAYRGGRCECFKTGIFEGINSIDVNNLYGYASMVMKFPDLKSESYVSKPLTLYRVDEWLGKIGVSRAMLYNEKDDIGLLPIRTDDGSYYPKAGKYVIGTWTNDELKKAIEVGWKLIHIAWGVSWDEHENPFKEIISELYELRTKSKDKFDYWFFKQLQNHPFGKMAQRKKSREMILDSVEKFQEYTDNGFKAEKSFGYNYLYVRELENKKKRYYVPIIPTLINAKARVLMYDYYKKIGIDKLIYTDTDSIMFKGKNFEGLNIGKEIGRFKIVDVGEEAIVYGKKTYMIGNKNKISGIRKLGVTNEDFKAGEVEDLKMMTINNCITMSELGGFKSEKRDLRLQTEKLEELQKEFCNTKVFKDKDIIDLGGFVGYLNKVG